MGFILKDHKGEEIVKKIEKKRVVEYPMSLLVFGMLLSFFSCTTISNSPHLSEGRIHGPLANDLGKHAEPVSGNVSILQLPTAFGENNETGEGLLLAATLNRLGDLYLLDGQYELAEILYMQSLAVRENLFGPRHSQVGFGMYSLANLYDLQGFFEEAAALYKEAFDIFEVQLEPEHPDLGTILSRLAIASHGLGRDQEAEAYLLQALHIQEKKLGPESQPVAITKYRLGALYFFQKRYSEAEVFLSSSLSIREKRWGPNHPILAKPLRNYAALLDKLGRNKEADAFMVRSNAIRKMSVQFFPHPSN